MQHAASPVPAASPVYGIFWPRRPDARAALVGPTALSWRFPADRPGGFADRAFSGCPPAWCDGIVISERAIETESHQMNRVEVSAPTAQATVRNPWRVFALLVVVQFMVVLDGSIVVVALPSIQADLQLSPLGMTWVLDAYLLIYGGFLLIGGRAADLIGRRRLVFWGMGVFAVASLVCGLSVAGWQLIIGRVCQGFGAALAAPAALALVTDIFTEGRQRNQALAIWGGVAGIGGATGVLLGGLLTTVAWQWAFLINIPIGAMVLILGARMLPPGDARATGGIDVVGAFTGTAGLCLLVFAVVQGGSAGWTAASTLYSFGLAALLLVAFALRQLTAAAPLVPRELFRQSNVMLGNTVNALVGGLLFGGFLISTLYLQQVRGYGPLAASLVIVLMNLAIIIGTQTTARALGRRGPTATLLGGLGLQAAGLIWWASSLGVGNLLLAMVLPSMLWCAGLGMTIVSAYVLCTSGLTGPVAGAGSGLVSTTFAIGGAVGVAVLTTVAAHRTQAAPVSGTAALASGYSSALWAALLMALVSGLLTLWLKLIWTAERAP
ncbi:MAG: MFS transporter [Pseudonocardiaceae bacterium]